jgi:hypothetical protein
MFNVLIDKRQTQKKGARSEPSGDVGALLAAPAFQMQEQGAASGAPTKAQSGRMQ